MCHQFLNVCRAQVVMEQSENFCHKTSPKNKQDFTFQRQIFFKKQMVEQRSILSLKTLKIRTKGQYI